MKEFSEKDVANLIDDFYLYSGNIKKISDVSGPSPHDGNIRGVVSTFMDDFQFSASPIFCDENCWMIQLPNPVASLREGFRLLTWFEVPKLHLNPSLKRKYEIANYVYSRYHGFSGMSEEQRMSEEELLLGYAGLPTYGHVMSAIIRDFRSFKKARKPLTAKQRHLIEKIAKDIKKKSERKLDPQKGDLDY